ncbi:RidA family protein [Nocardioides sp. LS1]|uniref:RidA family protein n=1 Tax=Nocardioides sp. LS1 TaxID=1027620 RepID=UPI00163A7F13|nr:RidA family protein [Nocardioides sp. LS1]
MTTQKLLPETMPPTHGWPQVTVATGSRIVFTSGQVAQDTSEEMVAGPDDYKGQMLQAMLNGYAGIAAAGGTPQDVVRLMIYVVDPTPETLEQVYAGFGKALAKVGADPATMTLIGVAGLSDPTHKVEVDLTAVLD